MKYFVIVSFLILSFPFYLTGEIQALAAEIDSLHEQGYHSAVKDLIEANMDKAVTDKEKAEIYWRLSRTIGYLGKAIEEQKGPKNDALQLLEKAEKLADIAIQYDPANSLCYFWKAANKGNYVLAKGLLDSFFQAVPLRDIFEKVIILDPEHVDTYAILSQMYELIPGAPISFGDVDFSVSLSRKAIFLQERHVAEGKRFTLTYACYTHLANHLYKRNWNADKRISSQEKKKLKYNSASSILVSSCYYEGIVSLPNLSDRDEAYNLIRMAVNELEKITNRTPYQNNDLAEARDVMKKWHL